MPEIKALLVYPAFAAGSFMFQMPFEVLGAKANIPPVGLMTLAALLPATWKVRLLDCNINSLTDRDLEWADVVMTGGMVTQHSSTVAIVEAARLKGKQVVCGGPDVTSRPEAYGEDLILFLGEAEEAIGELIDALQRGETQGRYGTIKHAPPLTLSPAPRLDLINIDEYLQMPVQYTRGCPFICEFCDVAHLFGRNPRCKGPDQIIAELNALYQAGYRGMVYFLDDNLIGNKREFRILVPELIRWQTDFGYPFQFHGAVSFNLVDDDELMSQMRKANFVLVFIGVETAGEDALAALHKKQNRRNLQEAVRKLHSYGMVVTAGLIVGLDDSDENRASELLRVVNGSSIAMCMVSILYALPNTDLTRRLEREGRLLTTFQDETSELSSASCVVGPNFITKRPRSEIRQEFGKVIAGLYDPRSFFRRLEASAITIDPILPFGTKDFGTLRRNMKLSFNLVMTLGRRHPRILFLVMGSLGRVLIRNPTGVLTLLIGAAMFPQMDRFRKCVAEELALEQENMGHVALSPFQAA